MKFFLFILFVGTGFSTTSNAESICDSPRAIKCSDAVYYQLDDLEKGHEERSCQAAQDLVDEAIEISGVEPDSGLSFVFRPHLSGQYGGTFISIPEFDSENRGERLNTLLHELGHYSFHKLILDSSPSNSRAQIISQVLEAYGDGVISSYDSRFRDDETTSCSTLTPPSVASLNLSMGSDEEKVSRKFLNKYHELYADFFQCSATGNADCRGTQSRSFANAQNAPGRIDPYNYFSPIRQNLWTYCFDEKKPRQDLLDQVAKIMFQMMGYEVRHPNATHKQMNLQMIKEIEQRCPVAVASIEH